MPPLGLGLSIANQLIPFTPVIIANLFFWVRADLGIVLATGNNVSGWNDQSGSSDTNHNLIQTTAIKQPILNATDAAYNNKSTLSFNAGNNTSLQSPANLSPHLGSPSTIYVACNSDGANIYYEDVVDGNDVSGGRQQIEFNSSFWSISAGGAGASQSTNSTASPIVICAVFNGSSSKLYISAATDSPLNSTPPVSDLDYIALGSTKSSGLGLNGKIAEVIMYSGSHDAPTRASIMNYLGTRYGIAIGP